MGSGGGDLVALLLLGGLLALGLPHITRHSRRRVWHPWVNTGLLPLALGLMVAPWLSEALRAELHTILALATAAAGVLLGTQLRIGYLRRAGGAFLRRHSVVATSLFLLAAVPCLVGLLAVTAVEARLAVAWSAAVGALLVVTSQRPPIAAGSFRVYHRDVVLGHVAPAGWWNLCALGLSAALISLPSGRETGLAIAVPAALVDLAGADRLRLPAWAHPLLEIAVPVAMGLVLGWLAQRARNREEAYLFLLAVLGVAGGIGLILGCAPLFSGLLIGAVFVNVPQPRLGVIENALEGIEQPTCIGAGLLAGLVLEVTLPSAAAWCLAGVAVAGRWMLRGVWSPTSATLGSRGERRLMPPGASGVLLVAILVSMGSVGQPVAVVLTVALIVLTAVSDLYELGQRRAGQEVAG